MTKLSTRTAQEQIITRFPDGKMIVDYRGNPQGNYTTGGVTHRFNSLSRVLIVTRLQAEGTPYQMEAVEYGTSNAVKIKFYDISSYGTELSNGVTITPLNIDATVIGL